MTIAASAGGTFCVEDGRSLFTTLSSVLYDGVLVRITTKRLVTRTSTPQSSLASDHYIALIGVDAVRGGNVYLRIHWAFIAEGSATLFVSGRSAASSANSLRILVRNGHRNFVYKIGYRAAGGYCPYQPEYNYDAGWGNSRQALSLPDSAYRLRLRCRHWRSRLHR